LSFDVDVVKDVIRCVVRVASTEHEEILLVCEHLVEWISLEVTNIFR
jgi:hypothetical protein